MMEAADARDAHQEFETRTPRGRQSKKALKEHWGQYEALPLLTHPILSYRARPVSSRRLVVGLTDRYAPFTGVDGVRVAIDAGILYWLTDVDADILIKRGAVRLATPDDKKEYRETGTAHVEAEP
jgi:hypothetical protein